MDRHGAEVETLYVEHRRWLSLFIQRRTGCPEATADLIQDTYLRVLASGRLPAPTDARRYLTQIAKGLIIDGFRRRRIEIAYLDYLHQQPEALSPPLEQQAMMIEALSEIDSMLQRLPAKVRQALLLRQLEGLAYREIAQRMGISTSSVEKYVAQGLRHILLNLGDSL